MTTSRRSKRYFSDEDEEVGVTPSQLKRVSRTRQIEYMTHWFGRMFEDPANETPYNSEEGGYLYIYGGPYDAREQLENEFGSLVSEERIEEVTKLIEQDGTFDWAPGTDHSDHLRAREEYEREQVPEEADDTEPSRDIDELIGDLKRGVSTHYGSEEELRQRREIVTRLDALRQALRPAPPIHGGIGHNGPPRDVGSPQVVVIDVVRQAEDTIRTELEKPAPDALEVALATSRLKSALGWLAKKGDLAAEGFAKEFGSSLGKAAGPTVIGMAAVIVAPGLREAIDSVIRVVSAWLTNVTIPF